MTGIQEGRIGVATLMLTCPTSAEKFDTRIEMDEASFKALPNIDSTAPCPKVG